MLKLIFIPYYEKNHCFEILKVDNENNLQVVYYKVNGELRKDFAVNGEMLFYWNGKQI